MISVLCVDDEPGFLELTRAFLELQGDIIVYGSPSALQAIDMLKTHSYDVVVSDYQMPGMDGLKFLAHVRNRHGDLPFILFTGKGREEVVIQALNGGADFYLQKGGEAKSQFAELAHKVRQAVERKKRNDALSLAEFSVDNAAVITIWSDQDGRVLKANKAAAQLLGFAQEELLGMRLGDLDRGLADVIGGHQMQEGGRQARRKSTMRRKDGSLLPVDITDNYFIMGGRKYGLSFGLDISESQKAESALRHSEERFQALVENANSIIIKADLEGRITYANSYALGFFGYSADELLGRRADETILPRHDVKEGGPGGLLHRILDDVDRYRVFENENARKDGSRAWVSWTNTAVRDENGVCLELLSIGNDITPLKEAELKLRASQGRLMEAQRLGRLGDLHYEMSPSGEVQEVIWSEEAYRIMGFEGGQRPPSMEEMEQYVHPSDRELWRASLGSVTHSGGSVEFEHRLVLKGGEVRHVHFIFKTVMRDDGGRRYIGVVRDLSEIRRAEEALRESERRYRTIADLIPDSMYVADAQGVVRYANHGIVRESGRGPEELLGRRIEELFAPEMAARQREDLSRVIETREPLRLEIRDDEAGSPRWLDVALVPILAPDGGVAEVIGTSRDITKIKRAEEELWEVASSYRSLTENMTGLVYRVHLREDERLQMFNDMLLPLTGYRLEELSSDYYNYATCLIDPDDSRWVLASVREAVESDRPFDIEYRLRCKDGRVIHVRDRGRPMRGADGTPLYIDGVMFDDSERKRSEVAVRDKERKFRELADMLPAFVFETDEEGALTFVNETARAMVGVGREELAERKVSLFDFLDPEDHERARNRISALRDGEKCMGEAFDLLRRDGSRFQATMHCVPIIMDGSLVGMRGLLVDISALRESERIQEAVHNISQAALIEEHLEDLYQSIHATLKGLMPLENFYIAIYDEDRDEISFPYFVDQKDPRPSTRRKGKGMSEYLLRTGQPILTTMDGIRHLQESGEIVLIGTPPVDFMAAPLVVEGKNIGLMVAQNYDPRSRFSPKHLEMMKFVSHQVAMAIKSKRQQVELGRYATLLQSTFESTDDGILIVDSSGRVLAANDRFTKMWCIPESIARSRDDARMLEFVTDQLKDPDAFFSKVRQLYSDPKLTSFDRIEFKDGRFFERYSQPFYLEDRAAGRIWSFRDVTERTRTEIALNESERELKSIINSAEDVIFVKDLDGLYIMANDAMGRLFHLPTAELIGMRDEEIMGAATAEANARSDLEVLEGKTLEVEAVWRIGQDARNFGIVKAPLKDDLGKVVGICSIARDMTERRKVERALKEANESLNLLSSITRHDVLNQLMVIRGYSDLVRAALKDQRLVDYMDKVERATRNIRTQILFTRDFQRLGTTAPKWQTVEELLDRALTNLEIGQVDVSVDLAGLEVLGDPMMEKVFYNLLDNTIRHGEGATRVSVSCRQEGGSMLVVYEDNGVGVRDEDKERIFERGFGRNTGLGLFLVRLILNVTGIKVREIGEYGKGIRFELTVPDGAYRFREWDDKEH